VVANTEAIGDISANATTRGHEMEITAESHMNGADLTATGNVHLEHDFPGKVEFKFSKLDFDPLLRAYLGGRVSGHSSANGTIILEGPTAGAETAARLGNR